MKNKIPKPIRRKSKWLLTMAMIIIVSIFIIAIIFIKNYVFKNIIPTDIQLYSYIGSAFICIMVALNLVDRSIKLKMKSIHEEG